MKKLPNLLLIFLTLSIAFIMFYPIKTKAFTRYVEANNTQQLQEFYNKTIKRDPEKFTRYLKIAQNHIKKNYKLYNNDKLTYEKIQDQLDCLTV